MSACIRVRAHVCHSSPVETKGKLARFSSLYHVGPGVELRLSGLVIIKCLNPWSHLINFYFNKMILINFNKMIIYFIIFLLSSKTPFSENVKVGTLIAAFGLGLGFFGFVLFFSETSSHCRSG